MDMCKVIQFATHAVMDTEDVPTLQRGLFALCNDGTIWQFSFLDGGKWMSMPLPPQPPELESHFRPPVE
jgi:hypothetical protein